jgi:hypothetical protein
MERQEILNCFTTLNQQNAHYSLVDICVISLEYSCMFHPMRDFHKESNIKWYCVQLNKLFLCIINMV